LSLVNHVTKYHKRHSGNCPICTSKPGGDPNYISQDLSAHMKLRHNAETDDLSKYNIPGVQSKQRDPYEGLSED